MRLHIRHETVYRYDRQVKHSVQFLRLTPRTEAGQKVLSWELQAPGRRSEQLDAHGNVVHLLTLDTPHEEIRILATGVVDTEVVEHSAPSTRAGLSPLVYALETPLTVADERLKEFATMHGAARMDESQVMHLAGAIREAMDYVPGATAVSDAGAHAFSLGRGVCQDHAHVMIACCRVQGVPARYVSGYLLSEQDDHIASHAWVDVWLDPQRRWLAVDVTNRSLGGAHHCRLAVGRDYLDACPIRGVRRGGGAESMHAQVRVSAEALPRSPAPVRSWRLQQVQARQSQPTSQQAQSQQ